MDNQTKKPSLIQHLNDNSHRGSNRDNMSQWMQDNGVSEDVAENYLRSRDNQVYNILYAWFNYDEIRTLITHLPRPSTTVPGRIAYYSSDEKLLKDVLTPIKVRRYLDKFERFRNDSECKEELAKQLDAVLQPTDRFDVRLLENDDLEGWGDAYQNNTNVASCMADDRDYGVSEYRTYRCYCAKAFGLPDNGMRLAVLYQDGVIVARCIVWTEYGDLLTPDKKLYVRSYGDSRLERWLIDQDYKVARGYPEGTILASIGEDELHIAPYVDGSLYRAEHSETHEGEYLPHWILADRGSYDLQDTTALPMGDNRQTCECCGNRYHEDDIRRYEDLDGTIYDLCENCVSGYVYSVYTGRYEEGIYIRYIGDALGDDVFEYEGDYYTRDGLEYHDLVFVGDERDGDIAPQDECNYVDYLDEWHLADDTVYVGGCDIDTGWSGDYVHVDDYNTEGVELKYLDVQNDNGDSIKVHESVVVEHFGFILHESDIDCYIVVELPEGEVAMPPPNKYSVNDYPYVAQYSKVFYEYLTCVGM